jgi:hypothetical protein
MKMKKAVVLAGIMAAFVAIVAVGAGVNSHATPVAALEGPGPMMISGK